MRTPHRCLLRRRSRAATLAVLLVALPAAGCSGGHSSATPPLATGAATNGAGRLPSTLGSGPTGTLYVGGNDGNVYAFPLNATGNVAPSRTITPHPGQQGVENITAITTLADGKLAILQAKSSAGVSGCRVVVEDANADGSPAAKNVPCDPSASVPTVPAAIARNPAGGFDLLYGDNSSNALYLKRFAADGATLVSTLPPVVNEIALATDGGGHDYLLGPDGEVRKYKAATTDGSVTAATFTVSGSSFRAIAVAPDKTVYVAYGDLGSEYIVALVGGTVTRTIGPFAGFNIGSMAVDSLGELYVGLGPINSGVVAPVRVYAADANGMPPALRVLRPTPALPCTCNIAISE